MDETNSLRNREDGFDHDPVAKSYWSRWCRICGHNIVSRAWSMPFHGSEIDPQFGEPVRGLDNPAGAGESVEASRG